MNDQIKTIDREDYNKQLKPCPHCKGKAEIHPATSERYAVFCMNVECGAMMLYTRKPTPMPLAQFKTLVTQWNKRKG